jgi:hypothetical protein
MYGKIQLKGGVGKKEGNTKDSERDKMLVADFVDLFRFLVEK